MSAYWQVATRIIGEDPRKQPDPTPEPQPLDDVSLVGQQHQKGESSTAAMGRIAYRVITGKEPHTEETKEVLSYLVHWIISMGMSGVYGALRDRADVPDVPGGAALGMGLWLFGDEIAMPLLGLTDGPTAYPPALHWHGLGAHLAYGMASANVTQALEAIFPD
jgi:hypothetical protein